MRPPSTKTLADLIIFIGALDLSGHTKRDLISAIKTLCEKLGRSPEEVPTNAFDLRLLLQTIQPAAHGIKRKTLSNLRSLIASALKLAGQLDDLPRGLARRHKDWQALMNSLFLVDKPTGCALATFANWCAYKGIEPVDVTDQTLSEFQVWLETRSLYAAPKDLVRQIPIAWERAQRKLEDWPPIQLRRISFKAPRLRTPWNELPDQFRHEAEVYLSQRKNPDLFDEDDDAPSDALADSTLYQQREHLRIAASILMREHATNPDQITLASLVSPNRFKAVLRSLINAATDKHRQKPKEADADIDNSVPPNAFVINLATTLIQVARHYVKVRPDELGVLKKYKSKLKPVPLDLTQKNKRLLRQLEVPATQAKLMFLPELLQARVANALRSGRIQFVDAQIAVAVDLQLVLPLRPQNLHSLHWQRHFMDLGPDGLRLIIPAAETLKELGEKTKRGQLGRILKGKVAGGLGYGYGIGSGPTRGDRVIIEHEAEIVRRIFKEHGDGRSPEAIAKRLNQERISGPRGRPWSNTTIRGQAARGTGLLNNEMYRGVLVWNRCSYVKDPHRGKKVARPNPPERYEITDVPHLRIVDDALWIKVKARQEQIRRAITPTTPPGNCLQAAHRARFLLSGLLECGSCGGGYTIVARDRYGVRHTAAEGPLPKLTHHYPPGP